MVVRTPLLGGIYRSEQAKVLREQAGRGAWALLQESVMPGDGESSPDQQKDNLSVPPVPGCSSL